MEDQTPPEQVDIPQAPAFVMTAAAELSIAAHVLQHVAMDVGAAMPPGATNEEMTEVSRRVLLICLKAFGPPPRKSSWIDDLGPTLGPLLMMLGQSLSVASEPVSVGPLEGPDEPEPEPEPEPPN